MIIYFLYTWLFVYNGGKFIGTPLVKEINFGSISRWIGREAKEGEAGTIKKTTTNNKLTDDFANSLLGLFPMNCSQILL